MGGERRVKLLFDQNLPNLSQRLADLAAVVAHVRDFALAESPDANVWAFAAAQDFIVVTKDGGFRERVMLAGPPPKVVHLKIGNCPLAKVESILRQHWDQIVKLHLDPDASLLMITQDASFLLIRRHRA
jgi:predicted nuclease of predicted toxin-antitoxin system